MKTFLFEEHQKLGAKIVDFSGWQMPLNYESAIKEHEWVRNYAGLFDISHMARIEVLGPQSEAFLDQLLTNYVDRLVDGQAQYAIMCHESGGAVDDVIIYRIHKDHYFVVVNASNREKDLLHLQKHSKDYDIKIVPCFEEVGILALQGPKSCAVLSKYYPEVEDLDFMYITKIAKSDHPLWIARSGYSGELGYEIYGPYKELLKIWTTLLKEPEVKPIGLAARDSLRLEMGYALYGHEMSDEVAPTESGAKWAVKLDKKSFIGIDALKKLQKDPEKRSSYAALLEERAIARSNMDVYINGEKKGEVTSGGYSPTLKRSIALILVQGLVGPQDNIEIEIRSKKVCAQLCKLPFIKNI